MINDNTRSGLFPAAAVPGAAAAPQRPSVEQRARDVVDLAAARSGDRTRLQREVEKILAVISPAGMAEERAEDGGLRLSSMNAVFAIAVIDRALGGGVLPRLRGRTRPVDFRTTATVAALLARMLAPGAAA